jgi:hypothetical protein
MLEIADWAMAEISKLTGTLDTPEMLGMVIVLGFPGILIQEWTTTGQRTLGISVTAMIEQLSLGRLPPPVSAQPCPNSVQTQGWVPP